jgi:STE24 endopeptidase
MLADFVKSLGLNLIIGAPLLIAFLHIVKWGGQHFYLYVVAFQVIVQIVMIWLYPTFIQPCFNKVEPLREGDLKTKIEALAVRLNYPLKKLFEIDGSKRSSHSNAYQYGFCGSKHIVLFDTLLKNTPDDAIEAIVAHELGHWSHSHVLKMMCASVVNSTASLFLYGFALHCAPLFHAFGFHDEALPTIIGFTLAGYISAPLSQLLGFVFNNISRYFEFQADMFAVSQGMAKPLRVGITFSIFSRIVHLFLFDDTFYSFSQV